MYAYNTIYIYINKKFVIKNREKKLFILVVYFIKYLQ